MSEKWIGKKQILGCVLVGVYTYQLHVNEECFLFSNEFVLKFRNPNTLKSWYWRIGWFEDENSNDHLIIKEQDTPEPLQYMIEPIISKEDYIIMSSQFSFADNLINKVSGYGFKDIVEEILTTLVLEFEDSFLLINTSPVIEIRYLKDKPNIKKDVIFSFE